MANKPFCRLTALVLTVTLALSCSLLTSADEDSLVSEEESSSSLSEETSEDSTEESFNVEDNSRIRNELKEENSSIKEKIKLTEKEIKDKEEQSKQLQAQIGELSASIKASNETIRTLNAEILDKQDQIEQKKAEIENVLALLRVRLRAIHTSGDTSSLEIILGAKSFEDFIDKTEMIKNMAEYDNSLIRSIQGQADIIAREQKDLRQKKSAVEAEKVSLEKNKEKINALLEENTKLIQELMTTKNDLQNEKKENDAKQAELKKALDAYRKRQAEKNNTEIVVTPDSDGSYVWPCPGFTYLTSTFDEWRGVNNHGALDIAEAGIYGAKVVACSDGVVFSTCESCTHDWGKFSSCGCGGGYGNYVMIDHGGGKISIYGHLSGVTVSVGQSVVAGQLIGFVGSTGYSTGAHLHFETRYNNVRYDPLTEY